MLKPKKILKVSIDVKTVKHRLNAAKENQNILEKDAPAPVLNDYICQKKSFLLHTYPSLGQDYLISFLVRNKLYNLE